MSIRVIVIEADGETALKAVEEMVAAFAPRALPPAAASATPVLIAPARNPAPKKLPAPARPERPVKSAPQAAEAARKQPASPPPAKRAGVIERDGITVDPTAGDESISFRGRKTDLTGEMAKLAAALARGTPEPIGRDFLIRELGLTGEFASQLLSQRAATLREACATIGLEIKTVRGIGILMAPVEG